MCIECGNLFGHKPGCPNRIPEIVGWCIGCGENIYDDEQYYTYDGTMYHEGCAPESVYDED